MQEMNQLDEQITTSLNGEGFMDNYSKKDANTGIQHDLLANNSRKAKKVRHSYQQNLAIMQSRMSGSKTPPKSITLKQFELNIGELYSGFSVIR